MELATRHHLSDIQKLALDFFSGPENAVLWIGLDGDNRGWPFRTLGFDWAKHGPNYPFEYNFSGLLTFDCTDPFNLYSSADTVSPELQVALPGGIPQAEVLKLRQAAEAAQKLALGEMVSPELFDHYFSFNDNESHEVIIYSSQTIHRSGKRIPQTISAMLSEGNCELVEPRPENKPLIKFLCNFQNQASMNRLIEDTSNSDDPHVLDDRPELKEFAKNLFWHVKELAYTGKTAFNYDRIFERGCHQWLRDNKNQFVDLVTHVITKPKTPIFTKEEQSGLKRSLEELEQALQPILAGQKDKSWEADYLKQQRERNMEHSDPIDVEAGPAKPKRSLRR